MLHKFTEAADLIDAEKRMKKTMWGQFWSSHQRFFKYLCIASKVKHVCQVADENQRMGKCVVIGLQSTGEARTIEQVEREEELTDFVSTSKGVLQVSLVWTSTFHIVMFVLICFVSVSCGKAFPSARPREHHQGAWD